jgi:antirestriction protein
MTWKNVPSGGRHTLWALGMAMVMLAAPTICSAEEILITIDIAPATLNIQSNGKVVTVHTDIAYSNVDVYSVYLGGVYIDSWKADDRGYFVAKFVIDDIKGIDGLVIDEYNILQFVAATTSGDPVLGEADVMVIDSGTGGNAE